MLLLLLGQGLCMAGQAVQRMGTCKPRHSPLASLAPSAHTPPNGAAPPTLTTTPTPMRRRDGGRGWMPLPLFDTARQAAGDASGHSGLAPPQSLYWSDLVGGWGGAWAVAYSMNMSGVFRRKTKAQLRTAGGRR